MLQWNLLLCEFHLWILYHPGKLSTTGNSHPVCNNELFSLSYSSTYISYPNEQYPPLKSQTWKFPQITSSPSLLTSMQSLSPVNFTSHLYGIHPCELRWQFLIPTAHNVLPKLNKPLGDLPVSEMLCYSHNPYSFLSAS